MAALIVKVLRQIDHMLELAAYQVLEIYRVLAALYGLTLGGDIAACQSALATLLVIYLEYLSQLLVGLGVAEAA